jgi:hypothetical protein
MKNEEFFCFKKERGPNEVGEPITKAVPSAEAIRQHDTCIIEPEQVSNW